MEYDDERPRPLSQFVEELPGRSGTGAEVEEDRLPVSVMKEVIATILSLRPQVRDVVCWRYAGMMYRDIAAIRGVTTAAIELQHRRALKRWPSLQALFGEKLAKQARRKPHRRRP